jgi:hypothetical protein
MRRVALRNNRHGQGQDRHPIRGLIARGLPANAQTLRNDVRATRSIFMWDVVMLALAFGLFAAGIGYAYACERL